MGLSPMAHGPPTAHSLPTKTNYGQNVDKVRTLYGLKEIYHLFKNPSAQTFYIDRPLTMLGFYRNTNLLILGSSVDCAVKE